MTTSTMVEDTATAVEVRDGGTVPACAVPYDAGALPATVTKDIARFDPASDEEVREPRHRGVRGSVQAVVERTRQRVSDAGMVTAEYGIGMIAAAGFATALLAILKGGEVKTLLLKIITQALRA